MFAIYDFDRFSKHDQIGQVHVPLNSVDLGRVIEEWRDITSPDNEAEKVSGHVTQVAYRYFGIGDKKPGNLFTRLSPSGIILTQKFRVLPNFRS